jgi:hypothetical protein
MKTRIVLAGCLLCLLAPAAAPAQVEEAQAKFVPWSGYWWPHVDGGIIEPLKKYDKLTGKKAAAWEGQTYPAGPGVPDWAGYCHAWSSSSIMEREPKQPVKPAAQGDALELSVGDQKGLLCACHSHDECNSYGQRNDGQPDADPEDLRPDELWRLLKLYVKQQGVPLVLDIDPGPAVWNYPIYAYRAEYSPNGEPGQYLVRMTIWLADDAVPPDYVGTKVRKQDYQFTCQMQGGSVVMGSAKWIGPSKEDHPDFAWYPMVQRAENPEVEYAAVQKLLAGGTEPPPPPPPQPRPPYPPDDPNPQPVPVPPPPPGTEKPPRVLALSPRELLTLVTNKTSSFDFFVTVDRNSGGEYAVGEKYTVSGSSKKAGYLYLLLLSPPDPTKPEELSLSLLFPLPGQDNRIPAGGKFAIPGPKDKFEFKAAGPVGTHLIKAIVTTRPLSLTGVDPRTKQKPDAGQGLKFRLPPTQQRQVQEVLQKVRQDKMTPAQVETFTGVKPRDLLGEWAQGEVPFYVKARDKDKPKPKQDKGD